MNILMLSWRGPGHPLAGGAELAAHEHAKTWVKRGHNVTAIVSRFKGGKEEEVVDGVKIMRLGDQYVGVKLAAFNHLRKNSKHYDLVVDEFHGLPFFTPLYSKTKILGYIHEVAKEVWWQNHFPFPLNFLIGLGGNITEPFIFRLIYKKVPFMTVSNSTKRDLVHWGIPEENISVIYNGTEKIIQNKPKKEKTKTVIFLGAAARDKGIEEAIEAVSKLSKDIKVNFWIVGRGNEKYISHLKDKIQGVSIKDVTHFWGYVSKSKKYELLSRAHILINPSVREGWGLVNIEANMVGTPVVAYRVAGSQDSIRHNQTGLLVKKGDTMALSLAIKNLLTDDQRYLRFQKEAIAWSKNFSWEKSTAESTKLIESL